MIDTHAHLYAPEFENDLEEVVLSAKNAGVTCCWLMAENHASLEYTKKLQKLYPDYFILFAGLHPTEIPQNYRQELKKIRQALIDPIYKGIGEIGLDLHWDTAKLDIQKETLLTQLNWATNLKRPVSIHVRDAYEEIMPLIRPYYKKGLHGIFHCFSGTYEQAKELTEEGGFLLGVNGNITYKNTGFKNFIAKIPLEYIVTETDAPYLSPIPFRGKRNQPANIKIIVKYLAGLYQLPENTIAEQTGKNANSLFK